MSLVRLTQITSKLLNSKACRCYSMFNKPIIQQTKMQTRTFKNPFKRPSKSQIQLIDNVPDEYQLIYRSTMERYLQLGHAIVGISVVIGGIILVAKSSNQQQHELLEDKWHNNPKPASSDFYVYTVILAVAVAALHLLIKQTPIRIYYYSKGKNYIVLFNGMIPTQTTKLSCTCGDLRHAPEGSFMPWKESNYVIKNKQQVILMEENFRCSADLYIMLGVQKDHGDDE